MTPLAAGLLGLLAAQQARTAACPCPCPPTAAADMFVMRPSEVAFAHNRRGRDLYRQRRFAEARAAYQAALDSDPSFLAPRLNIACAWAQEERFPEAVAAATALAQQRYVPWAAAIQGAADLAPLAVRPEAQTLRAGLQRAAMGWGASLTDPGASLLFVARTLPPVRLPPVGTLVLALNQEIFAYLPALGAHRQVTAEDGRVLAFVRTSEGSAITYVTGGKLVRAPGQVDRLRGLAVRRLDLPRMTLGPAQALTGDLVSVALGPPRPAAGSPAGTTLTLTAADRKIRTLLFDGRALIEVPARAAAGLPAPTVLLDAAGVARPASSTHAAPCPFTARDAPRSASAPAVAPAAAPAVAPAVAPAILVQPRKGAAFTVSAPHGAGLAGLPFPAE